MNIVFHAFNLSEVWRRHRQLKEIYESEIQWLWNAN